MKYILPIILIAICVFIYRQTMGKYKLLTPDEFARFIESDPTVQVVDVRTAQEFSEGHIPSSRNIDYKRSGFKAEAGRFLNMKQPVAIYCRSGMRSAAAGKVLSGMGYQVVDLEGGILAWSGKTTKD